MKKNQNRSQTQKPTQKQGFERRDIGRESGHRDDDKSRTIGLGKDSSKFTRDETRK